MSAPPIVASFPARHEAAKASVVLGVVMASGYIDRQLLGILVEPIRKTLGMGDTQLGLLQGTAFIMVYAVMGVPAGRLVDKYTRKRLLCGGIILWSAMTIACGLSQGFWSFFIARAGVGLGEAMLAPATFSMLADFFEPRHRGRAIATVTLCGTLGAGLSYVLGGTVLELFPGQQRFAVPLIGTVWGWQIAFLLAGSPGLVIGLLTMLIMEPPRQESVSHVRGASPRESLLRYAAGRPRAFVSAYLGSALLAGIAYAIGAWQAAHFMRSFGLSAAHVGYAIGLITIVCGVMGGFIGGLVSDWLVRRGDAGRLQVLLVCAITALGFIASWPLVDDPTLGFALLAFAIAAVCTGTSTASVTIQEIVPNEMRGEALGFYFLLQGIVGPGLAPVSVALVSDSLLGGQGARLGAAIACVTVPSILAVAGLAWWGSPSYATSRRAVTRQSVPQDDAPR